MNRFKFFIIVICSFISFSFVAIEVKAACDPPECGTSKTGNCSDWGPQYRCQAKCCWDPSGGGGGGGGGGGRGGGGGGAPTPPPPPPPPSCTVSLSPDPASISESATQVYTASVVPANGSVTRVDFTFNNTSVASVAPASDTSSPYNTTATGVAAGSTTIRAGVIMSSAERCSDTAAITVTAPEPWWQVQDADVVTSGNLVQLTNDQYDDLFPDW